MTEYRSLAQRFLEASKRQRSVKIATKSALAPAVENLCCEVYNAGGEEITFTTIHPEAHKMFFQGKSPQYWAVLKCKPGEFVFLPHQLYIPTVPSGSQEIQCVVNYGESMFIGNKLPSAPEARKIRSFIPK